MDVNFYGYDSTISRNEGWNFGKLGQVLERADKTSRVLDAHHHLLESASRFFFRFNTSSTLKSVAYDMYRKKYGKLSSCVLQNSDT
jgi:uncharacterized alpha-E superfamily protein